MVVEDDQIYKSDIFLLLIDIFLHFNILTDTQKSYMLTPLGENFKLFCDKTELHII